MSRGDVLPLDLGGGGGRGYGDPRAREGIEADLADGRITPTHAAEVYGYSGPVRHLPRSSSPSRSR